MPQPITIAILAAGSSTRMGAPKQLMQLHGESLLRRTVRTALETNRPVLVITGASSEKMMEELAGEPLTIVDNGAWQEGIASSIRCAIRHCTEETGALLVMTVDQPLVTSDLLERIMGTYEATGAPLVACRYAGTVGVPALYDRSLFPELLTLVGDTGAKTVIQRHGEEAHFIDAPECAVDIDTSADWDEGRMTEKDAERLAFYELKYRNESEPWEYSRRAVEQLRLEFVVQQAMLHKPSYRAVLDMGSSLGQLTFQLDGICDTVYGMDVSDTAVRKASAIAAARRTTKGTRFSFVKASATDPPFESGTFDLILLCDGVTEWGFSPRTSQEVLEHVERLLTADGVVILTDYMHPRQFDAFIRLVQQSPLTVVSVHYLHDRLCYQFESLFHAFYHTATVQSILRSRMLARLFVSIGKAFGKNGSKHIGIVARKSANIRMTPGAQ